MPIPGFLALRRKSVSIGEFNAGWILTLQVKLEVSSPRGIPSNRSFCRRKLRQGMLPCRAAIGTNVNVVPIDICTKINSDNLGKKFEVRIFLRFSDCIADNEAYLVEYWSVLTTLAKGYETDLPLADGVSFC